MTTGTTLIDLPIPERFNWLLGGIRRVIGLSEVVRRRLVNEAIVYLAWHRLGEIVRRFNALYEKWRAGTLKPTRKQASRKGEARATPRTNRLSVLPRRAGWLTRMVSECAWGGGSLLMLLEQPDILAFITEVPQARRILRPLCGMFVGGTMIPAILKLPRRPRPPKPKARKQRKRKPRPFARIDSFARSLSACTAFPPTQAGAWPLRPKNEPESMQGRLVTISLRYRNKLRSRGWAPGGVRGSAPRLLPLTPPPARGRIRRGRRGAGHRPVRRRRRRARECRTPRPAPPRCRRGRCRPVW